jgi:hypothetical protein
MARFRLSPFFSIAQTGLMEKRGRKKAVSSLPDPMALGRPGPVDPSWIAVRQSLMHSHLRVRPLDEAAFRKETSSFEYVFAEVSNILSAIGTAELQVRMLFQVGVRARVLIKMKPFQCIFRKAIDQRVEPRVMSALFFVVDAKHEAHPSHYDLERYQGNAPPGTSTLLHASLTQCAWKIAAYLVQMGADIEYVDRQSRGIFNVLVESFDNRDAIDADYRRCLDLVFEQTGPRGLYEAMTCVRTPALFVELVIRGADPNDLPLARYVSMMQHYVFEQKSQLQYFVRLMIGCGRSWSLHALSTFQPKLSDSRIAQISDMAKAELCRYQEARFALSQETKEALKQAEVDADTVSLILQFCGWKQSCSDAELRTIADLINPAPPLSPITKEQ